MEDVMSIVGSDNSYDRLLILRRSRDNIKHLLIFRLNFKKRASTRFLMAVDRHPYRQAGFVICWREALLIQSDWCFYHDL
ncbi:hypothetical protein ADS79_32395 [Brevibacillus reuszeri]|uniref:Uncharacterized protein n=1 Tax=Brevibacillus reuszeri TaxID=54915 RepID=A0A0K9YKE3_9BACL|nr:hypothetical protein ADS79_32395 [Brevibacillus reuszeri]